jgi:hypothetical protein
MEMVYYILGINSTEQELVVLVVKNPRYSRFLNRLTKSGTVIVKPRLLLALGIIFGQLIIANSSSAWRVRTLDKKTLLRFSMTQPVISLPKWLKKWVGFVMMLKRWFT